MTEPEELASDLRAIYGEIHPNRDPEAMRISDDVLALGVLLRREMRLSPGVVRYRIMTRLAPYTGVSE